MSHHQNSTLLFLSQLLHYFYTPKPLTKLTANVADSSQISTSEHDRPYRLHHTPQSVLLFASTPEQLLTRCQEILHQLQSPERERHYAELIAACASLEIPATNARVGFVAESLTETYKALQICIDLLTKKPQAESWDHPQGIYYRKASMATVGKVVALFSGQHRRALPQ
jgi:acyl transferase domain-containing protein